ncbi:MAG: LysR family transcriptional regulator [Pseudomonadota bacterium]
MDARLQSLDWALVNAFLAVAEEGSLSAAARRLGASQPTLGRQVKAIESALSASLFTRHARGLELTEMGEAILPAARVMASAMNDIRVAAAAQETQAEGTVRITASINVAHALLPKVLARVRREYPGIQIDLVPSDDSENLLYGESDLAVRMYRPRQVDLVTQYLGTFDVALYGARSYLDAVGRPGSFKEVLGCDLVGFDTNRRLLDGIAEYGIELERKAFATRCDDPLTQWELVVAGCGLGFAPRLVGDADARVEEIPLGVDIPGLPMWLTASQAMRRTPRIRAVWEIVSAELGQAA